MIDTTHASAIAIAAAAFKTVAAAEADHSAAYDKRTAEERDLQTDEAKRSRLVEAQDNDAALRHLDGDAAAPDKPQRAKTLAALNEKIPRRKAAIPILKAREAEAAAAVKVAQLPFAGAVMEAVSMIQEPAAERVRAILAELAEPLIEILAADFVRLGTIGDRFSIPIGKTPPFNGGTVVSKLLNALPDRLRPAELSLQRLEAQARAAATIAISSIKDNRK